MLRSHRRGRGSSWDRLHFALVLVAMPFWPAHGAPGESSPADQALAAYFRDETGVLANRCLADIQSLADWQGKRGEYRRQFAEMLGLWPMPERTDLKPVITGQIEESDFRVEKLHFQSKPGLYVTANLYLPASIPKPAPAILYVCGHAVVKTNGVSYGNKVGYQHHGIWFARHGYVCLVIDTLQLGEIEGLHHGTHREGMWWWNSRGYSPAGIEAWNSIRALDYLCSRPEVDPARIGMTGRSGGGSYTWTTAALDDRVKAMAPVAGITDLQNHVVDGCVEGHCDCMYFVNTYRWDFALNAALMAPRPLLIVNTDADSIFPLDGVQRVQAQTRRIYRLHDAAAKIGLVIGPGPHKDTQDLQVPVLRWFNQHLKGEDPPVALPAVKLFQPQQLKVFDQLPPDQINTSIHQLFKSVPATAAKPSREMALGELREKSFRGWPEIAAAPALELKRIPTVSGRGINYLRVGFTSQRNVELQLFVALPKGLRKPSGIRFQVLDQASWAEWHDRFGGRFESPPGGPAAAANRATNYPPPQRSEPLPPESAGELVASRMAQVWLAPRGIGPTAWSGDARKQVHIRRRFMLLGQTLDGMRVWDIQRGIQAAREIFDAPGLPVDLDADGNMAANALYAALFDGNVREFKPRHLPDSLRNGPDYLNVLQVLDIPQALELVRAKQ